jgi:hypothetical protein
MRGAGIVALLGIATACSSSGDYCSEVYPPGPLTFDGGLDGVVVEFVPAQDAGVLPECARDSRGIPVGPYTELPATDPLCAKACHGLEAPVESQYGERCRVWPTCHAGYGATTLVQCQEAQGGLYAC